MQTAATEDNTETMRIPAFERLRDTVIIALQGRCVGVIENTGTRPMVACQ